MTRVLGSNRVKRADVVAACLLLGVPLVVLSIPALAGYPLLTGDDLTQSYPLSVLYGQIIAHGHLPVYNPYLWSGTPLLGSANAHVLLPATLLFALLPSLAAWVVVEALTLGACAIGCFVLLRRNGCRTLAAALAGATFGLGGFVSSQVVHIDFVSAAASLIWCLVALDGIGRGDPSHRGSWALVLAIAVACLGLSASPDIVVDALVAIAVYGGHLLITTRARASFVGWAAAGALTGLLVGALQWLPAAEFVAVSERAHAGYVFASSGSVSAAELLISAVPHVLGGGPIGLEAYTGPYNLAELDAYCGICSLVAVAALAARWRSAHAGRWRVWYLVGAFGLLLALGANTPLEHLIVHLPVVGQQRLPSRALVLVSLAASMLLGYWIEDELAAEPGDRSPAVIAAGAVPPVAVLAVIVATVVSGRPYGGLLDAVVGSDWSLRAVAPYLVVAALLALAACAIVLLGSSWPRRRLALAIAALVVMDLALFTVNQSSLAPTYARTLSVDNRLRAELAARLSDGGRFLVVDPALSAGIALDRVGAPDLNVLSSLASAQGYGSLTWGPYASATGTHSQNDLYPEALRTGVFDSLGVRVLLTVPGELSVPRTAAATAAPSPGTLPGLGGPSIAGDGTVPSPIALGPGRTASRWFGRTLEVTMVTLVFSGAPPSQPGLAPLGSAVRLIPAGAGRSIVPTRTVEVRGSHDAEVFFPTPSASIGLVTGNPLSTPVRIAAVSVTTAGGSSFGLDGALTADLTAPHWLAAGRIGPFVVYDNTRARGPFWVAGSGASARGRFAVRVLEASPWTATETVSVTSSGPATMVRSVADIPGWRATEDHDGRTFATPVRRDGLVQSISVPAGTTIVTFTYAPPGFRAGLVLFALGILGMLVLAIGVVTRASRRRRAGRQRR